MVQLNAANFPTVGTVFKSREEATGVMKTFECLRGREGVDRKIVKREGKPYQNWKCTDSICDGSMKIEYEQGENKPGQVASSIPCVCPKYVISKGEVFRIEGSTAKVVREGITRRLYYIESTPIIDFRASPPPGWQRNHPRSLNYSIYSTPCEDTVRWRESPSNKRMKTNKSEIPPAFKYFGKLPTGRWFGVGIGCIKQENEPRRYISLNIPDPDDAATRPIPGNSMDAWVSEQLSGFNDEKSDEEQAVEGVTMADTAKSAAKPKDEPMEIENSGAANVDATKPFAKPKDETIEIHDIDDDENEHVATKGTADEAAPELCWVCIVNVAVASLPCNANALCNGSLLCNSCLVQLVFRRRSPVSDFDLDIYHMNEHRHLTCLKNCEGSCIKTYIDLQSGEVLPLMFPWAYSYDRPMIDRDQLEASFPVFESVYHQHKNRRKLAEDIAFEDTVLSNLKNKQEEREQKGLNTDDLVVDIAASKKKTRAIEIKLDSIQIPAFAKDWKMTTPLPENSTLLPVQIPFRRRPIGSNFEGWWLNCVHGDMSYTKFARSLESQKRKLQLPHADSGSTEEAHDDSSDSDYLPTESASFD